MVLKKTKLFVSSLVIIALSVFVLLLPKHALAASTFTVNVTTDAVDATPGDGICATAVSGQCSLRAAIVESNANANPSQVDTIAFAIPGAGSHVITPASVYPLIIEPVRIDGSTQGSINCSTHSLLIEVSGAGMGAGFANLYLETGSIGSSVNGYL
jgi:trimeric autotransporter adhesin